MVKFGNRIPFPVNRERNLGERYKTVEDSNFSSLSVKREKLARKREKLFRRELCKGRAGFVRKQKVGRTVFYVNDSLFRLLGE